MKALRIRIFGIVQGVGFRPFVSRLAKRCGIVGTVSNRGSYVEVIMAVPAKEEHFSYRLCEMKLRRVLKLWVWKRII